MTVSYSITCCPEKAMAFSRIPGSDLRTVTYYLLPHA